MNDCLDRDVAQQSPDRFAVFAVMWAAAAAIHLVNHLPWPVPLPTTVGGWAGIATLVACFLVFAHPSSVLRFLVLAGLQIAHVAITMPNAADHWLLMALVNGIVLIAGLRVFLRRRTRPLTGSSLVAEFAPPARLVFILCYGFAALAKWNAGFLEPEGSCGSHLLSLVRAYLPFVPDGRHAQLAVIYGTILAETTSPLLLLLPGLRVAGIVLCAVFHFSISHTPGVMVADFSATVSALLFLFTPDGFMERLRLHLGRFARRRAPPTRGLRGAFARMGLLGALVPPGLLVAGLVGAGQWDFLETLFMTGKVIVFAAWGAFVVVALIGCLVPSEPPLRPTTGIFSCSAFVYAPFVAIALLNGASPYLGLKTQGSFTMFSNLQTERGSSNHLLVPGALQVASYQRDYVQVLSTSYPGVQRRIEAGEFDGRLFNLFEVQRLVALDPDASLTWIKDGRRATVERIGSDRQLGQLASYWMRKVMVFRSLPADGSPQCVN